MLPEKCHIAKFIATESMPPFTHGTKLFIDMRNGHTRLQNLEKDDGREIPFRVVATAYMKTMKNYDLVQEHEDYSVIVPFGARVKHARWLFATGDVKAKIDAIAQLKELVLREKKSRNDFSITKEWIYAMQMFTNFCNTSDESYAQSAFDSFVKMIKASKEESA